MGKVVNLLLICAYVIGIFKTGSASYASRVERPHDLLIRTGEESIEVHWTPPQDIDDATFCSVEYKADYYHAPPVVIPVQTDLHSQVISGLRRNTRYKLRIFCFYNHGRGPVMDWVLAPTRTASVEHNICSGTLPNAFLSLECIADPQQGACWYNCAEGFRLTLVPPSSRENRRDVICQDGNWTVRYADEFQFRLEEICLPEATFQKCPLSLPNAKLEYACGPATDWLCAYTCNGGFHKHPYLGIEANFEPVRLLCEDGTWKTGYEHRGLEVSDLCISPSQACPERIPHGRVPKWSFTNGYMEQVVCDAGYRYQTPAEEDAYMTATCIEGQWLLRTTIYDQSITIDNVCILNNTVDNCQRNIPNGRVPEPCTVDCTPVCDVGYHVVGKDQREYRVVSCEDAVWKMPRFYASKPYSVNNICFPDEGIACSRTIPHGEITDPSYLVKDNGISIHIDTLRNLRQKLSFTCSDGYRRLRGVPYLECVAGQLYTWQERFGIDVSSVCIPRNSE